MILFAALALAVPEAAPPPTEEDIVIIGQRVRKVKFTIKPDKAGRAVCRIKRSSGDPEIDGLACDAARACMGAARKEAFLACLTPKWKEIPATLAARRRMRMESGGHARN